MGDSLSYLDNLLMYITISKQVKIAHMTFVVLRGLKRP